VKIFTIRTQRRGHQSCWYQQKKIPVEINNETELNEKISRKICRWDFIPGSELDDKQEEIGSEDEENNYYSIGGDNHNDLKTMGNNTEVK
jgi:hypothetical protein